ncbi:MAG: hypothetical protein ABIQ02_00685 [Saprospiraceae bacterium]
MNYKLSIVVCLVIFVGGCSVPNYIPKSSVIQNYPYGALVHVTNKKLVTMDGELIAIDSNQLILLSALTNKCISIPVAQIAGVSIKFAKMENGAGIILAYSILFPLSHGAFFLLSAPINSIVSSVILRQAYTFKNLPREKLKMFARFPQGIPPNVDINRISLPIGLK